ncbi:MAG: hypothetical protein H7841_11760 [Magnetospirillum sp. WYHS-4]
MHFVDPDSIPTTGNAAIDAHHRHIAHAVNHVYEAWKGWDGIGSLDTSLAAALRDVEIHLTVEEIITRGAGYQEWKFHETLHDALRSRLRDVAEHAGAVPHRHLSLMQAFEFFDQMIFQHEFFDDQDFWDTFRRHAEAPRGPRLVTWDSRLVLGENGVDSRHSELVAALNAVHEAIADRAACDDVLARFDILRDDWLAHLETEVTRIGRPESQPAKQAREAIDILRADLALARRHCEDGDCEATGAFLVNQARFWLLDHITYQHRLF